MMGLFDLTALGKLLSNLVFLWIVLSCDHLIRIEKQMRRKHIELQSVTRSKLSEQSFRFWIEGAEESVPVWLGRFNFDGKFKKEFARQEYYFCVKTGLTA